MRLALKNWRLQSGRGPRSATVVVVLVTVFIAAPIVVVLARVGSDTGGLWAHLLSTVLPGYVWNTIWLAVGVGGLATVFGVATAWAVTLCRFPGRRFFRWALLLPFAIPTYLSAYAYTDLLQFSGPVQSSMREAFDWSRADYWFPEVRSLEGAIVILSMALYPYVYLAARAAFLEQSVCLLEVGRTLGLGPWRSFFRIAVPLARPSIVGGVALVLMETLAEFGAVQYCAVDTFATGIYRAFTLPNRFALTAAAQLSACLLGLILMLVALEAYARRSARFHHTTTRYRALPAWELRGPQAILAAAVCFLPVALGFGIPFAVFVRMNWLSGDARASEVFLVMGRNSFLLGAIASALALLLALLLVFGRRLEDSRLVRFLSRVAGLGYAIPGAVIAIGIVVVVTWIDRRFLFATEWLFGAGAGLLLSGSVIAILYGYQTRFLAVALNLLQAGMTRIQPSLDSAARTLGASPLRMLLSVHLPLLRPTLVAAALLVFVDVVKELPATLILRPFGFETLAVRVYQLASDERLAEASSGALAIIFIGLLPVAIFSRLFDRLRPGSGETAREAEAP